MAAERGDKIGRMLNVALLVAGYGFGQGSIFLAQSWLVARGQLELLALFGTHFAFAIFGILVVEAGSLTLLARHAASLEHGEETAAVLWRTFWETSVVRVVLAALVIAAALAFAAFGAAHPFSRDYVLWAAPAFLLWAVNAAGFLDGLKLSGISGISGSCPYAASAVALVLARNADPAQAGALLGGALSAGYALTLVLQFAALRLAGWRPLLLRPTRRGVVSAARDGLALLAATLPGQVYYRLQLLISSAWLGPAPTALLVYLKQIVSAAAQLISFFRRVEFPALVRRLAADEASPIATIWDVQMRGTLAAGAATGLMILTGGALAMYGTGVAGELGGYLAVFALTVGTSAIFLAFSQGLAALGRFGALFRCSLVSTFVGLTASLALAHKAGVYGFAIADLLLSLASIAAVMVSLRRVRRG